MAVNVLIRVGEGSLICNWMMSEYGSVKFAVVIP